jgi:hypothetical protein
VSERIIALDPGTAASGLVILQGSRVIRSDTYRNEDVLLELRGGPHADAVACEMVSHYGSGMAVGREVFETVEWIGRFREAWEARGGRFVRVYRREVKIHLCGSAKAKDPNVRQALLDRYGGKEIAIGRKNDPGPLYGVSGHEWQALAVGVTALNMHLPPFTPAQPAFFEERT